MSQGRTGALLGLGAAALFGVGAPASKLLLGPVGPVALAGLLYLGAGVGLSVALALRGRARASEAALRRADAPLLLAVVACGGIAGPVLLMLGLARTTGLAASLLLNLEAPLTMLLAVLVFGEHLGRRGAVAAALVVAGAVALALRPGDFGASAAGAALVAGACLCWAVDNNLTQRLSLRDPLAIVRVKSLGAGLCTLAIAAVSDRLPAFSPGVLAASLALGLASYGASVVLAVYSMRLLGAAREAAWFATAPFLGALASVPLLGERPGLAEAAAGLLMAAGTALLLLERHAHVHAHEPLVHEHAHVHDEHHGHAHEGPVQEPHSHEHEHAGLVHEHPHVSDAHHRHPHRS